MTFHFRINSILFLFLIFITNRVSAQNLVFNPSFEDTLPCPTNVSFPFLKATHWIQPTGGSSDFFNTDTNCAWAGGVPQNVFGFQIPNSGIAYCGFSIYNAPPNQNVREYITGTLSDSLIVGKKYCVSFYISAADNCKYQTDDIGVYFSSDTSSFTDYTMNNVLNQLPQVENTQGNILSDTLSWIQVTGDFIAQGGEKFLTIGNFKNDANTTLTILSGAVYNFGYYYIDDVSVIDCTVGLVENEFINSDIIIYPNPARESLTILMINFKSRIIKYEIINIIGDLLNAGEINHANETINISELNSGLYTIRLSNQNGSIVKRFIKL